MKYSIILPVYNEYESIPLLWSNLKTIMDSLHESYEVIFIDDGSSKSTIEVLSNLKQKNNNVVYYRFNENKGQTEVLREGFEMAKGDIILTMDSDLQDNPKYIPEFINKINEGYDVVCGYRKIRNDKISKIILSKIGNFIQKTLWRTGLNDIACTYRAYKKACIKHINLSKKGYHRYIPYFLGKKGFKITEIEIMQDKRAHSKSRYSVLKAIDVFIEFVTIYFKGL